MSHLSLVLLPCRGGKTRVSVTLKAILTGALVPGRFRLEARRNSAPGPPGWGLCVVPTTLPHKTQLCYGNYDESLRNYMFHRERRGQREMMSHNFLQSNSKI